MSTKDDLAAGAAGELAGAGVDNARFEAQLLLMLALDVPRSSVVAGTYAAPTEAQEQAFNNLVARRKARVPLAYLRGTQEFYGLEFEVTPDVLIPRPETERLVELALERAEQILQTQSVVTIADVGTGSGCIPAAILKQQVGARAVAIDISPAALAVARRNAQRHGVLERLRFAQSDLLSCVGAESFDIVVSNPPYIPSRDVSALQPEVARYEPQLALDGGSDGLTLFRALIQQAKWALKPNGWLWMEVGQGQAQEVSALLEQAGYADVQTYPDHAGIERIVGGNV